jgi:Domain of unknown function (DUF6894)
MALPLLTMAQEATVPLYYFHFSDGKHQFTDATGHELIGIAAARMQAMRQVRELKSMMDHPRVQDVSGWTMAVVDMRGNTVFEIGFDLRTPPVREYVGAGWRKIVGGLASRLPLSSLPPLDSR